MQTTLHLRIPCTATAHDGDDADDDDDDDNAGWFRQLVRYEN